MTKIWAPLLVAATLAVASPASAADIKLLSSPHAAGSGGEFTWEILVEGSFLGFYVEDVTKNINATVNTFQSFCVEQGEFITEGQSYDVSAVEAISRGTAALYGAFAREELDDYGEYDYVVNRLAAAEKLQQAIWYLEGQAGGVNNSLVTLLTTYAPEAYWKGDAEIGWGVFGLKLTQTVGETTTQHQNQVFYVGSTRRFNEVPDGGTTLALMGFALLGIAVLSRRFGLGATR